MRRLLAGFVVLAVAFSGWALEPRPAQAASAGEPGTVHGGIYSSQFFSSGDLDGLAGATGKRVTFGGTFHSVTENDNVSGWHLVEHP
jgi:hypothetical protein